MAWIESHQNLGNHPKLKKMCRLLGISEPCGVGHLHYLWWWALEYAPDGRLDRVDDLDIAIGARWDGDPVAFREALVACGWIDRADAGGSAIHDWWDYAGKLLEKRERDADRKRSMRESVGRPSDVQRTSNGRPSDGAENPSDGAGNRTVPYQTVPNQTEPEDENTVSDADAPNDVPLSDSDYPQAFEDLWMAYHKVGNKRPAFIAWRNLTKAQQTAAARAAPIYAALPDCTKERRKYQMHLKSWLHARGWEAIDENRVSGEPESAQADAPADYVPHQNYNDYIGDAWQPETDDGKRQPVTTADDYPVDEWIDPDSVEADF